MAQSFPRSVLSVGPIPEHNVLKLSSDNNPELVYLGAAEIDEKQDLLDDENRFVDEIPLFVNPTWRRDPLRRTHPLWNLVKIAATIGSIGLLSYGLIKFSDSECSIACPEGPFLTFKPCH
jgi:hypothetical protein